MNRNNKIISASILSANFAILGKQISQVLKAGADWIHIDVMDNHFVPNLSFGPMLIQSLREYGINAPLDVHLMTENSDNLIKMFASAGANYITIHPESTENLIASLNLIKDCGCKAGIALKPETNIDLIKDYYNLIDLILIMSVNPGFGGQKFLEDSCNKIIATRKLIDNLNSQILLAVDGGINQENIGIISKAGANVFVAGSSVFKNNNFKLNLNELIIQLKYS